VSVRRRVPEEETLPDGTIPGTAPATNAEPETTIDEIRLSIENAETWVRNGSGTLGLIPLDRVVLTLASYPIYIGSGDSI